MHVWYIIRAEESQYALRNYYEGNFVNGRRHGQGTFHYSSGTKYVGEWKADQKHGKVCVHDRRYNLFVSSIPIAMHTFVILSKRKTNFP
jgi:MORN repeat